MTTVGTWKGLVEKLNNAFIPALYDDKLRVIETMVSLTKTDVKSDEIDTFLWPIAKLNCIYPLNINSAKPVVSDLFKRCYASIDPECSGHSHGVDSGSYDERRRCFDARIEKASILMRTRLSLSRFGPVRSERDLKFFLDTASDTAYLWLQESAGLYTLNRGSSLSLGNVGWRQTPDPSPRDKEKIARIMKEHCELEIEFPVIPDPDPRRTAAFFCVNLFDFDVNAALSCTERKCIGARMDILESVYESLLRGGIGNKGDFYKEFSAAYEVAANI